MKRKSLGVCFFAAMAFLGLANWALGNTFTFGTPSNVGIGALGLLDSIYHGVPEPPLTGFNAPTDANIDNVQTYTVSHSPSYIFLNTNTGFQYTNTTNTKSYLGTDAAGAASTDLTSINGTIFEAMGYIDIPQAGVNQAYTFSIANNADDAGRVIIGGNGAPGTGTIVAEQNYNDNPMAVASSNTVEFTAAGLYPIEVLTYQDVGGASFGFTITGAPYSFTITPEPSSIVAIFGLTGMGLIGFVLRRRRLANLVAKG